jgi:hypothetical protein
VSGAADAGLAHLTDLSQTEFKEFADLFSTHRSNPRAIEIHRNRQRECMEENHTMKRCSALYSYSPRKHSYAGRVSRGPKKARTKVSNSMGNMSVLLIVKLCPTLREVAVTAGPGGWLQKVDPILRFGKLGAWTRVPSLP